MHAWKRQLKDWLMRLLVLLLRSLKPWPDHIPSSLRETCIQRAAEFLEHLVSEMRLAERYSIPVDHAHFSEEVERIIVFIERLYEAVGVPRLESRREYLQRRNFGGRR